MFMQFSGWKMCLGCCTGASIRFLLVQNWYNAKDLWVVASAFYNFFIVMFNQLFGPIHFKRIYWCESDVIFINLNILISGLEICGLFVDYYDVFISFLEFHSDGTHPLQGIHWWASGVMLHFSKFYEETNSSASWTGVVWITCALLWFFISCLDSHSDGTHSLQSIHWWASDPNATSPNLMKKQTHLHLGWSEDE